MKISEKEYDEIRSSPNYVKFVLEADWMTFNASYRRPLLFWSTPLLLASVSYGYILAVYSKTDDFILGPIIAITLYMTLRHGLSAYSLWEFIQKKRKFYTMIKGIADKTGTYPQFLERYNNRNVR